MAYAGYLLYMYLNARKWTLVSSSLLPSPSSSCCLWTASCATNETAESKQSRSRWWTSNQCKCSTRRPHGLRMGNGENVLQSHQFTGYPATHTTAHTNRRAHLAYTEAHVCHSVGSSCSPIYSPDDPQDSCAAHSAKHYRVADSRGNSRVSS